MVNGYFVNTKKERLMNWTYPLIQPQLIEEAKNRSFI